MKAYTLGEFAAIARKDFEEGKKLLIDIVQSRIDKVCEKGQRTQVDSANLNFYRHDMQDIKNIKTGDTIELLEIADMYTHFTPGVI